MGDVFSLLAIIAGVVVGGGTALFVGNAFIVVYVLLLFPFNYYYYYYTEVTVAGTVVNAVINVAGVCTDFVGSISNKWYFPLLFVVVVV